MDKIWVISDQAESAYELITKAREFGGQITAFVVGDQAVAEQAFKYGADSVKLMPMPQNTVWEQYFPLVAAEANAQQPELVLVNASRRGKTLAAQLAAKLDCACVSECQKMQVVDNQLVLQRIIYGGLASKEIKCSTYPLVVTVAPHTFEKQEGEGKSGEVSELALPDAGNIALVERKEKAGSSVNLAEASVVIGVGRGFADENALKHAENLAQELNAELGCTRPISEDMKWLPEERYIGISGQQIKPDLYLCAGVSGQIQHVYGIRDSKVVVAINNNENAPIFKVSDYYIVGDLEEVLPALISAVKR